MADRTDATPGCPPASYCQGDEGNQFYIGKVGAMKKAIIAPGGPECPDCGGRRFTQGGSWKQTLLWGKLRAHKFIRCADCGVVLKKDAKMTMVGD